MTYNDELYHYGVLGMKWGKRRYTNPDGSLNALGKKRQAMKDAKNERNKAHEEYGTAVRENNLVRKAGLTSRKSDMRVGNAAKASAKADADYKQAKREYKNLSKQTVADLKRNKSTSAGAVAATSFLASAIATTAIVGVSAVAGAKLLEKGIGAVADMFWAFY